MLLVQATDKSGNQSGANDYRIRFEVDNRPSITEMLNYPNPFSTRTQFVFSLTGSEVPDQIQITIMTITGKVVKQIDETQLGQLRIGRNQTDFWWDGTDEFGDPLANGIYLYTVSAKLKGEDLELRENAASRFFSKGVGKMYLMR
jgi:flagellar hook assembly protein FlgD